MSPVGGVVTTGIYCREGCSARPHPANVVSFTCPAAAEVAGFRACLRCRPYRAELEPAWTGPELVCRGVQLVADGALDDATEVRLAARLDVSPRHLRRLFVEHLGVTPDQLARSRRAHFARRLLDDTDLRIVDIAFAAGFGSVRQLNRVLLEIFRATPSELRAHRRSSDRLHADGGLAIRLAHAEDLDFSGAIQYLADRAVPTVESVIATVYRRTVAVEGGAPGVIEISRHTASELLLVAHLPGLDGLLHLVRRARRIFGLDDFPHGPDTWDPFEVGVHSIITADTRNLAASRAILGELATRLGRPVAGLAQIGLGHTFPMPAELARSSLDGLPVSDRTARDLRSFSDAIATGAIRLDHSWAPARLNEELGRIGLSPSVVQSLRGRPWCR